MRAARLLVLALLAGLCVACGDSGHRDRPAAAPPKPFAPAVTKVPSGYREVLCPFWRGAARGLTVRLVVPLRTKYGEMSGAGCSFTSGMVTGVSVTAAGRSLASWRKKELDPFDGVGGDDEIRHISYRRTVPGFGGRTAERLTWWAYDDGLPFWQTAIQAAGVNLGWSTRHDTSAGLETVRRSVGVRRGVHVLCPFWGRDTRLTFTPPADHETVQREGDRCQIYFDGSPTVLQSASIDPTPAPLASLVARVRRNRQASHVRLEHGVARIAGRAADRLSWTVTRTKATKHYEPAGTWRIVVTQNDVARVRWGQTPSWWQDHRQEYAALVASVRRR
ncbi:MAG TPA: hypothetical protein VF426_13350 [Marmoricola sp.]